MKTNTLTLVLTICLLKFSFAQLVDGYTDKQSYNIGETVTFFTKSVQSSGTNQFSVEDINNTPVDQPINFALTLQSGMTTNEPWKNGYGYSSTATWTIPTGLKSGMYFLNAATPIPIIIKGDNSTADIVIVCTTNTEQAYTSDTHYNLNGVTSIGMYGVPDNNTPPNLIYSPIVSLHRPVASQGFMDGFLKWFFNSSYNSINVIADKDLDDYAEIQNSKLLIVIGHSEYWTRQARLNFDKFVDNGKDAMILSGNSMWWQVRYEDDNGNPQMICYRGSHGGYPQTDPICDPLLETTSYDKYGVKYSIGSSIGADWQPHGGFTEDQLDRFGNVVKPYVGFYGYNIILPNSPFLSGTGLQQGDVLDRNFASGETGEFDGTFIKGYDGNGIPNFNANQMGFYRGEIIGYDIPAYAPSDPAPCAPIVLLQKTCTSGRVINVSSNYWCRPSHFNQTNVQTITQNMIDLLLNGSNVFVSPAPTEFAITPESSTVSFSSCQNGTISITPCGVTISAADGFDPDGYRVDQQNSWSADVINCTSCNRGARMAASEQQTTTNNNSTIFYDNELQIISKELMQVYPNPNNGNFTIALRLGDNTQENFTLSVYNSLGILLQTTKLKDRQESLKIDLTQSAKGVYMIKLTSDKGQATMKKVIVE
jgi:hypothetical protein